MVFPIGDDQVRGGASPIFSYAFLALNVLVFLFQVTLPAANLQGFIVEYGSIPQEISSGEDYYTLLTSMFLHGGWMHLIGNMTFLWVFADNIEAVVGNVKFLIFYILGGIAASYGHIFFNPASTVPCVGASGAISAVLGAYLVMFPSSRIKVLVVYFFRSFMVPAILFLGFWIVQQLISGVGSLGSEAAGSGGGVAWFAHIGGFVFGLAAGLFFKMRYPQVELARMNAEKNYPPSNSPLGGFGGYR